MGLPAFNRALGSRTQINGSPVTRVFRRDGQAVHHAEAAFTPGQEVEVIVDWARRWDHMQQHSGRSWGAGRVGDAEPRLSSYVAAPLSYATGQHLLSAVAAQRFCWKTLSWYAP